MGSKVINADQIHLGNFHIFKWEIYASDEFANQPVPVIEKNISVSGEYNLNDEANIFGIRVHIAVSGLGEEKEELPINGQFGIEFHFEVENLTEHLEYGEENQVLVSDQLLGTLLGIAYSTSRGLVYDRLHGSFLEGTILPVINPLSLIREEPQ